MNIENFMLTGKKALVVGIANENSIAYGCAKAFKARGADLAITYLNEKSKPYVEPLADELGASIFMKCDVSKAGDLEEVFDEIRAKWEKLDIALHSIAFAPKEDLTGRLTDSSKDGFLIAVDVSCHSFIRMARMSEPLMKNGGVLLTMTYYGSQKVVQHYNLMGPVKAALESAVRYLAYELGPGIRVNAISPGPLQTRAASGLKDFEKLLKLATKKAPSKSLVTVEDIGNATAGLATDASKLITGEIIYIDGGYNIVD
ncbi:MAG TPA: enoyl-ACP reductase FabI [Thermodesulfobacteriota bacterium]|nr:enoyl-ACP reductase FabI [Thermodesulfobacteriota bacterium]